MLFRVQNYKNYWKKKKQQLKGPGCKIWWDHWIKLNVKFICSWLDNIIKLCSQCIITCNIATIAFLQLPRRSTNPSSYTREMGDQLGEKKKKKSSKNRKWRHRFQILPIRRCHWKKILQIWWHACIISPLDGSEVLCLSLLPPSQACVQCLPFNSGIMLPLPLPLTRPHTPPPLPASTSNYTPPPPPHLQAQSVGKHLKEADSVSRRRRNAAASFWP